MELSARITSWKRKLVLSSKSIKKDGIHVFKNFNQVLETAGERTVFVIGGGQIYSSFLPQCNELYITEVQQHIENGDTFFQLIKKLLVALKLLKRMKIL